MKNQHFELRPIKDLAEHHFFIPDYQRGYKWAVQQVLDLLEDIDEFEQIGASFYCLQPLAVKHKTNAKFIEEFYPNHNNTDKIYEVIDGQQRLTTVHIILNIISHGIYFLQYETRGKSGQLLENIQSYFGDYTIKFEKETLQDSINGEWKQFINKHSAYNNIDFYHFFTAYLTTKAWFLDKSDKFKQDFTTKIKEQTNFIWPISLNQQSLL